MRVLVLTPYFPPETGAAPARALHFARALQRAGHEVRVVTGMPNHPGGVIQPAYRGAWRRRETLDGITIERVWLFATPRKNAWTRLANHLSFALTAWAVSMGGPRPHLVLATTPPLFHGVGAWLTARLRGAAFVADLRDDWPHAAVALGEMRPGMVANLLAGVAEFFQRRAARLLVVTPGMRRQLEGRGFESRRLVDLPNGADTDLFSPAARGARAPGSPFTVVYAGTHGLVHGMEMLVDVAAALESENVHLRFLGDGVARPPLEARARAAGLSNVRFEDSVAPAELAAILQRADAALATTRNSEFAGETMPVKIFDYLAAGCPVVAAVRGDAAEIVTRSGGGIVVAPEDPAATVAALRRLRDEPGLAARLAEAGPRFVASGWSRRALGERMALVLAEVDRERRGRGVAARPTGLHAALKRASDVALAALGLVLLSPLMLAIAIAVRLESAGPALYRQRRSGRGSSEFVLLKFRSMAVGTPELATHLVQPGAVRVTSVGAFLRRTSLDEIPQLWNILVGDMSLVGPRPALHNQHDLIALRQAAGVDALRPGLTGWAQINGRDEIPMERKVAYDREYLERLSPAFDLEILVRTALTLFVMRGVR